MASSNSSSDDQSKDTIEQAYEIVRGMAQAWAKFLSRRRAELEATTTSGRRRAVRQVVNRDYESVAKQLHRDYFAEAPMYEPKYFRRRFRMGRHLFLRITKWRSLRCRDRGLCPKQLNNYTFSVETISTANTLILYIYRTDPTQHRYQTSVSKPRKGAIIILLKCQFLWGAIRSNHFQTGIHLSPDGGNCREAIPAEMLARLQIPIPPKLQITLKAQTPTSADSGLKFRRKVLYLQSLKVNPAKALHKNPNLRCVPLSTLLSVTECLSSIGIELSSAGRILDMYPELLTADPYQDIYPIFDFLVNVVRIPFPDVRKAIIRCPRLLVTDPETQLNPAFQFLTELGFSGRNRITAQTTMLLVSSVEFTLIPKISFLMGLGLTYDEVRNMVLRSPGLLTFSVEKNYVPKAEYFFKEMKGDLEELKRFPQYFSFSLERKIKPRHLLLMEHGFSMPLSEMLKVSDGKFNAGLIEKRLRMVEERSL